jgi:hypothetical protein
MDRLQAIVGITTYNVAIFQLFRVALHTLPNERVWYIWKWIKKGKCCLVHFQPFNGEAQALLISLYLVLESHIKSQKFQNSSPRLQYPTTGPYHKKILAPWISTLMLCRFIGWGINLAFLVNSYMRSLYMFCSTGLTVREKNFLNSSTFTTDFLLFYAETPLQRNHADDSAENLLCFIQ